MRRLTEIVNIWENNEQCVVLRVIPDAKYDLIRLGCFTGREEFFSITKGEDHVCMVIEADGDAREWCWSGDEVPTFDDKGIQMRTALLLECITEELAIYIGSDKDKIKETLAIKEVADTLRLGEHDITVQYDPRNPRNYVTNRDGEFFKVFRSEGDMLEFFASEGYILTLKTDNTVYETGEHVKHYKARQRGGF